MLYIGCDLAIKAYRKEHVFINKPAILCRDCEGKGYKTEDTNRMMVDAAIAIYMNHHMMSEKCKDCGNVNGVYLPCDKAQEKINQYNARYEEEGENLEECECRECDGLGRFHIYEIDKRAYIDENIYYDPNYKHDGIILVPLNSRRPPENSPIFQRSWIKYFRDLTSGDSVLQ